MNRAVLLLLALALGCGPSQDDAASRSGAAAPPEATPSPAQTPYGDVGQVQEYLESINPHIQEVGKIQLEVDKVVGSSGKATGQNLAGVMEKVKPRLQQALESFSQIQPPPLLAPFHQDIEKLMLLRLDAYAATIRGWQAEQKTGDESLYQHAEAKLQQANQLIVQLNEEMKRINDALAAAAPPPVETASP